MAALKNWQRRLTFKAIFKEKATKKRIGSVFAMLPVAWVGFILTLTMLEWDDGWFLIPFIILVGWGLALFIVVLSSLKNRIVAVAAIYKHLQENWETFYSQLDESDKQQLSSALATKLPDKLFTMIFTKFELLHKRNKEVKASHHESTRLLGDLYENAITLSLEWKRMETVYLLYLRSEDIQAETLQNKARSYLVDIARKTNSFVSLFSRFADTLNHLAAFELDAALAIPGKHQQATGGYHHLDSLIGELQEWSGSLTEAAEEMIKEEF